MIVLDTVWTFCCGDFFVLSFGMIHRTGRAHWMPFSRLMEYKTYLLNSVLRKLMTFDLVDVHCKWELYNEANSFPQSACGTQNSLKSQCSMCVWECCIYIHFIKNTLHSCLFMQLTYHPVISFYQFKINWLCVNSTQMRMGFLLNLDQLKVSSSCGLKTYFPVSVITALLIEDMDI